TGPYAEPLVHFLSEKRVHIVQINPMHTKRLKELQGNSPLKTDPKDTKVIADVMSLGHALTVVIPRGAAAELRRLTLARERAVGQRTRFSNQLTSLVYISFPEFMHVMHGLRTKTARYLLSNFPTPQAIGALGLDKLAGIIKQVSRGRISPDRAEALLKRARDSVGIKEGLDSITLEITTLLSWIERSDHYIGELESLMESALLKIPYSRYLLSIKGLSTVTSAGLIGEVGDFTQFKTIREIVKYAGLDLYEISSGKTKTGNRRISKRGRSLMRKLLFFASINMVKKDGVMYRKYRDYLDRGMPKMKALVAIMKKVLILVYALVRDSSVYVENYQEHKAAKYLMKEAA
ncbi:MAG: IS110 family transposase, partial [bacterium]|nr:IS110 family transposase [bacterium]